MGRDPLRHRSAGRPVELSWHLHFQGFVRTLLVELLPKPVEFLLLRSQAAARRNDRLLLQSAVHPLAYPILLRFLGSIPCLIRQDRQLEIDSKLEEPHRQLREPRQGVGCERHAFVGPDAIGQP